MAHIMKKTANHLVQQLKAYHLNHVAVGGKITAAFNVVNLSEWNALEKRLKAFNFVNRVNVLALYKEQIFVELGFSENTQASLDKMTAAGFRLIPQSDMYIRQR
jgi:hypothetical protein